MTGKTVLDELIERIGKLDSAQQTDLLDLVKQWQVGQQRRFERFAQQLDVGVGRNGKVVLGQATDLSAGGMFIIANQDFMIDQGVNVVFLLPDAEQPFKLKGRVVRLNPDGIAVEFENVTPYFAEMLDGMLRANRTH